MPVSRRAFLKLVAITVSTAAAAPGARVPEDDTAYIQGLLDNAARRGGVAVIPPGTYYVETLDLRGRSWVMAF